MKHQAAKGQNVILREQKEEDAKFFVDWVNQPQIMFQCGFTDITDEQELRRYIREYHQTDDSVWFTITDSSDTVIGETELLRMFPTWHCTDLTVIIPDPRMQNKGYGTETVSLMLDMAFLEYDMNRVSIGVVKENTQALSFYQKIGFKQEGIQEQGYYYHVEYSDFIMMRILRKEWAEQNNTTRHKPYKKTSFSPLIGTRKRFLICKCSLQKKQSLIRNMCHIDRNWRNPGRFIGRRLSF